MYGSSPIYNRKLTWCQFQPLKVHDHGQERKYPCPYCPASFIRSTHYNRHVKQFHSDPNNMKMPQVRYRGPNRSMRKPEVPPIEQTTIIEEVELSHTQQQIGCFIR